MWGKMELKGILSYFKLLIFRMKAQIEAKNISDMLFSIQSQVRCTHLPKTKHRQYNIRQIFIFLYGTRYKISVLMGRDSVVHIKTRCGLEGPEFDS